LKESLADICASFSDRSTVFHKGWFLQTGQKAFKIWKPSAANMPSRVFVSYSRHDEALVMPLAKLLGAAADDAVFLDVTSLRPGDPWKEKIEGAVRDATLFVLCWCCESQQSAFVAHEISIALSDRKKRLVPVLFCSTPLPKPLSGRQWVDLRGRIIHVCNNTLHPPEMARSEGMTKRRPSRSLVFRAVSLLFLVSLLVMAAFSIWQMLNVVPVKARIIATAVIFGLLIFYALYSRSRDIRDLLLYMGPKPSPDDEQADDELAMTVISYFLNLSRE
jgi:TIR domain